jgi:shikimate dehydrogenase
VGPRLPSRTGLYAVLGHPVNHSLSPPMQNAAFRAAGIDAAYVALDVQPDGLAETLKLLHAAGFSGMNLTAPHKEAALSLVSAATDEGRECGAVNTLRREESGWRGHATDGPGFAAWIAELGVGVRDSRVLLLGAGGAARSVAPVLVRLQPAAVRVVSRDGGRAAALQERLRPIARPSTDVTAAALAEPGPSGRDRGWNLLVRALASETVGASEASWWERLDPEARILDLNYGGRAVETRKRAAQGNRRFDDGMGMLLRQGALSFEFWTGKPAPLDAMRAALQAGAESR